jgi:hypothetical protein
MKLLTYETRTHWTVNHPINSIGYPMQDIVFRGLAPVYRIIADNVREGIFTTLQKKLWDMGIIER